MPVNSMKHFCCLFLVLAVLLGGCSGGGEENTGHNTPVPQAQAAPVPRQSPAAPFQSISVREAKSLMDSRSDLVILDVRTPEELKREGHIADSSLVPFWAIMQNKLNLPKDKPVMLICAVGGRSYAAGQMLVRFGYREVYNVSGGLSAWKKAGLPVKY